MPRGRPVGSTNKHKMYAYQYWNLRQGKFVWLVTELENAEIYAAIDNSGKHVLLENPKIIYAERDNAAIRAETKKLKFKT